MFFLKYLVSQGFMKSHPFFVYQSLILLENFNLWLAIIHVLFTYVTTIS